MPPPTTPLRASPSVESADRDLLLGNAYLLGPPDHRKGPHCMFTFRSIDAVIGARLTPDQLPHSIYDTPPRRVVMPNRVIVESVKPEPFLSLNHAAKMKYDPRWSKLFDIWGRPVLGGWFPLPELPKKRNRTHGSRTGAETQLSVTREEKSDAGKGDGKGIVAGADGYGFAKYGELPSVAAHSQWCARDDARVEGSDSREGHVFKRYRELPSVHAHGAWCARTSIGYDDDDGIETGDEGAGYVFERYNELPSVLAHTAWCKRTDDGDEEDIEEEDDKQTEEEDDKQTEEENDKQTEEEDGEEAEKEEDD